MYFVCKALALHMGTSEDAELEGTAWENGVWEPAFHSCTIPMLFQARDLPLFLLSPPEM